MVFNREVREEIRQARACVCRGAAPGAPHQFGRMIAGGLVPQNTNQQCKTPWSRGSWMHALLPTRSLMQGQLPQHVVSTRNQLRSNSIMLSHLGFGGCSFESLLAGISGCPQFAIWENLGLVLGVKPCGHDPRFGSTTIRCRYPKYAHDSMMTLHALDLFCGKNGRGQDQRLLEALETKLSDEFPEHLLPCASLGNVETLLVSFSFLLFLLLNPVSGT